jgi:hypothetical protein
MIAYTGLFVGGYVQIRWLIFEKETVKHNNIYEAKKFATKFRCKKLAELFCKFFNWHSHNTCDLKTFKVVEYEG